jgi:hypothetical protein
VARHIFSSQMNIGKHIEDALEVVGLLQSQPDGRG